MSNFWVVETAEGYRVIEAPGEPNNAVAGPYGSWSEAKAEAFDRIDGDRTRERVAAIAVMLAGAAVVILVGWTFIQAVVS